MYQKIMNTFWLLPKDGWLPRDRSKIEGRIIDRTEYTNPDNDPNAAMDVS